MLCCFTAMLNILLTRVKVERYGAVLVLDLYRVCQESVYVRIRAC